MKDLTYRVLKPLIIYHDVQTSWSMIWNASNYPSIDFYIIILFIQLKNTTHILMTKTCKSYYSTVILILSHYLMQSFNILCIILIYVSYYYSYYITILYILFNLILVISNCKLPEDVLWMWLFPFPWYVPKWDIWI